MGKNLRAFFILSFTLLVASKAFAESSCLEHLDMAEVETSISTLNPPVFLDSLNTDIDLAAESRLRIQDKWEHDEAWSALVKTEVDLNAKRLASTQQSIRYELDDLEISIPELGLAHNPLSNSASERFQFHVDLNEYLKNHMTQMLYKQIEFLSFFKIQQSEIKWLKFFLIQTMSYSFISVYNVESYESYKELLVAFDKVIANLQIASGAKEYTGFELSQFFANVEVTLPLRNFVISETKKGRTFLDLNELNPKTWNTF